MKLTKTAKLIVSFIMLSLSGPVAAQSVTMAVATPLTSEISTNYTPKVMEAVLPKLTPIQSSVVDNSSVECLVKVMNHEAGGEGTIGQKAVAYVVLNRVTSGKYPHSVCSVVYQPSQFTNIRHAKPIPANKYNQLKTLALSVLSTYSRGNDPTAGSTSYHNIFVSPNWRGLVRTLSIGRHIFYKSR